MCRLLPRQKRWWIKRKKQGTAWRRLRLVLLYEHWSLSVSQFWALWFYSQAVLCWSGFVLAISFTSFTVFVVCVSLELYKQRLTYLQATFTCQGQHNSYAMSTLMVTRTMRRVVYAAVEWPRVNVKNRGWSQAARARNWGTQAHARTQGLQWSELINTPMCSRVLLSNVRVSKPKFHWYCCHLTVVSLSNEPTMIQHETFWQTWWTSVD